MHRFAIAIAALVVVFLALAWGVELLSLERVRPRVEAEVSHVLGLETRFDGGLHLELIPTPRLEAERVVVASPEDGRWPHVLRIAKLTLVFDLTDLLLGRIALRAVEFEQVDLRIEIDEQGEWPALNRLEWLRSRGGGGASPPLWIRWVEFRDLHVIVARHGASGLESARIDYLEFDAPGIDEPLHVAVRGEIQGSALDLEGRLGSVTAFAENRGPWPVELRGRLLEADVELDGALGAPRELAELDARLSLSLVNLRPMAGEPGPVADALERIGPVRLTAVLLESDASYTLRDLRIVVPPSSPISGEVIGGLRFDEALHDVELSAHLEASELVLLDALVDWNVPEIDSASLVAHLSDDDGSLGIDGKLSVSARDGDVVLEIEGEHDDLSRIAEMQVDAVLKARDLALLADFARLEVALPDVGPVRATGRFRAQDGELAAEHIDIELGSEEGAWLRMDGSVQDLLAFRGVHVDALLDAPDVRTFGRRLAQSLVAIGPLRASAVLDDGDGTLGFEEIRISGGNADILRVEVTGRLDDFDRRDDIELNVEIEARDLAVIGDLVDRELPALGPFSFSGSVVGSDESMISRQMTMTIGRTRMNGDFAASFEPGRTPRLDAQITSPHIYLDDFGLAELGLPAVSAGPGGVDGRPRPIWLSPRAIPFHELRRIDGSVWIRADRVTGSDDFDLDRATLKLEIEGGAARLFDVLLHYEGGQVVGEAVIDADLPVPELGITLDVDHVDLTTLFLQFDPNTSAAGQLNGFLTLQTRGRSVRELTSNLGGELALVVQEGTLSSRTARRFVFNVARIALPFISERSDSHFGCIGGHVVLDDGVGVARAILLEADDVVVFGTGTIDLVGDELDLRFEPEIRDRGLISAAAAVEVSGRILEPEFEASTLSLARSIGEGLLRTLARPGTALVGLLRPGRQAEEICADELRELARLRVARDMGLLAPDVEPRPAVATP